MKIFIKIIILSLLLAALGCSKKDNEIAIIETQKSDAKLMTSFSFSAADNAALEENVIATVTEASKTVSSSLPNGTEIIALTPVIEISAKATISPSGEQDFRTPVTYTVTAEDGSTATYRVSLMIMASDAKQIVSFIFGANSNESIAVNVAGEIDEEDKIVVVEVPFGTDVTALLPTIVIPENAIVDPMGAVDFSEPVSYTLTAEDDTTVSYMVSINFLEKENSAPLAFELISPTINGPNAGVKLKPTLRWNASIDPDGDAVTYDVFLNIGETADVLYAENLTETTLLTEPLEYLGDYSWRIVAKDSDGATTMSETAKFSTRDIEFTRATRISNQNFSARSVHSSVVFDNKIWVIGGFGNGTKNDVWSSNDGMNWSLETNEAEFGGRRNHTSIVFDNKIWVIGGIDEQNDNKNDVWFSENGVNWTLATENAAFSERFLHSSVVFDDKIWVIGGISLGVGRKNDVWFSDDGVNWSVATNEAVFTARQDHTSVVFDDKIWVIGGFDNRRKDDVWSSTDGINWSLMTNELTFGVRANHTSVVFDNKIWVIAGRDGDIFKSDIWSSQDGVNWLSISKDAPFGERTAHTSVVFDHKVWVIGGNDVDDVDDSVWYFE